ncbi:hypothetical protein SAMN05216368_10912 [Cryobacterium flavum]|uniref:Translation initiation factor IF-2 N-terminal domain-containing protein n=1 Tax=Cryobacterium flavum TaxID=1424659 RepID=A0A5E9G1N4_9MICO|nr:hypothetical protein SAMN05216368_10912 [Cryobacterium flavum]
MSAKPRVHELARAFGIDVKIVLRMLKADGEFLKGPSSSMEPLIARRTRAHLIAAGYVELKHPLAAPAPKPLPTPIRSVPDPAPAPPPAPIRSTPYPVPAPPGKRWDATEPFVAFKQPPPPPATPAEIADAKRVVRAARAEQRALLAAQQAARDAGREEQKALRSARVLIDTSRASRLGEAKREALQIAVAAVAKRRQEEAEQQAVSVELGKFRSAEIDARIEDIARKGRARADQESTDRAQRAQRRIDGRLPAPKPLFVPKPVPVVSEKNSGRNVRQAIVARSDTQWSRYGISNQEHRRWVAAGLPEDRAHIPAMCRAFGSRGWIVTPDHLNVVLGNGLTVLQMFEAGSNIVQVMDQLALVRKRDFTGGFDTNLASIVPVLRDSIPEKLTRRVSLPLNLEATGVPELADYLLLRTRPSQDEHAIFTFNRERRGTEHKKRTGQKSGKGPGPLVRRYAAAHGVFGDQKLTSALLANLPSHVLGRGLPFTNIISDAVRDRQFYYLSAAATLAVEEDADGRIPIPEDYELPSTTGFAVLCVPNAGSQSGDRILLWSHGADELTAAVLSVADLRAGLATPPLVAAAHVGSVQGENGDQALALVAAIARAIRRPPPSDEIDRPIPARRPRTVTPAGRPLRSPADDADAPADHVSLIYAPGETHEREISKGSGRKAEKRWIVRRHLRLQFYPSSGERRPVWIEAHQSGAADGHLWLGDRVKVPRKGPIS